jgi:hypothetical protein
VAAAAGRKVPGYAAAMAASGVGVHDAPGLLLRELLDGGRTCGGECVARDVGDVALDDSHDGL